MTLVWLHAFHEPTSKLLRNLLGTVGGADGIYSGIQRKLARKIDDTQV